MLKVVLIALIMRGGRPGRGARFTIRSESADYFAPPIGAASAKAQMQILSRFRLRTKLILLMGLSALALIISIAVAGALMRQRMIDDRVDKLRAVVQSAMGVANILNAEVNAGKITREQGLELLGPVIHGMRFDNGEGYIIVRRDAVILLHGADPKLEGKASSTTDAAGHPLADLISDALVNKNEGTVRYLFPRPGQTQPQLKISYVATYAPWQVVFFAGTYVDDLDVALRSAMVRLALLGLAIVALTLLAAWMVNRDISGSLGRIKVVMEWLAKGDLSVEIPGVDRRDEVGAMAKALLVFKEHMAQEEKLAAAQEEQRQRAEVEKHAALVAMAEKIEEEMSTVLRDVGARTANMTATAEEMSASAVRTGDSALAASAASGQALENAQTVASAAEELAASIGEIGSQVAQSNKVVGFAVNAGAEARTTIETLNEEVTRIGIVSDMIGGIAAKTNLLALNATIEAARAGDAGKGFAVVASEVKALATQTARSTEEITKHIAQVKNATGASVSAVARIEQTIGEVSSIAGSIAAAVEEQQAATAEIARSVNETAAAANAMASRTGEVSAEAENTGKRATEVRENAVGLDAAVSELRHSVIRVVRTSTAEVDRRGTARDSVDLPCRLTVADREHTARLTDISEAGAAIRGGPPLQPGARALLRPDSMGDALPCVIRGSDGDTIHVAFQLDATSSAKIRSLVEHLSRRSAA